jgi:hypothetical protein
VRADQRASELCVHWLGSGLLRTLPHATKKFAFFRRTTSSAVARAPERLFVEADRTLAFGDE